MSSYVEPWHRLTKAEAPKRVVQDCKSAEKWNAPRRARACAFGSHFEGINLSTFSPGGYAVATNGLSLPGLNSPVVRMKLRTIVKGAHALLWGSDSPLPLWKSVGGRWDTQTQAQLLNRVTDSEYEQPQGRYDDQADCHRHAGLIAMAATGSVAVFEFPGYGKTESRINDTLTMRLESSGAHGAVIGCVATDYYDPEELACMFPGQASEIRNNAQPMRSLVKGADGRDDRMMVAVRMAYRCKVRDKDGRALWVLDNGTVLGKDREYEHNELPCAIWHFERELAGEWANPLSLYVYHLACRQNEIVSDCDTQQRNAPQRIVQGPQSTWEKIVGKVKGTTFIPSSSPAMDLRITEPAPFNDQSLQLAEMYEQWQDRDAMVEGMHQGAAGKLASSGKHEKFRASYFTEAFAPESRRILSFRTVQTARRKVRALKEMIESGQDIERQWDRGTLGHVIKLSDVDLDESKFVLRCDSVSEEKNSTATLLEIGEQKLNAGEATLDEYIRFRQTLDVDAISDRANRHWQWLEAQVFRWLHSSDEEQLEDDFYQSPRKEMDLVRIAERVRLDMLDAELRGAPPERLEYFELFLEECAILIEQEAGLGAPSMQGEMNGAAATGVGLEPAGPVGPGGIPAPGGQPGPVPGLPGPGGGTPEGGGLPPLPVPQ